MLRKLSVLMLFGALAALAQPGLLQPQASHIKGTALTPLPASLQGVGMDQKLHTHVPLHLVFHDEFGRLVSFGDYFHGKPVVLALVYYRCPMLCTQILNGVEMSLKAVSFNPGKDFEVVAVSFDPKDTTETAAGKRRMYLRRYNRAGTDNGWHFLTGDETNIRALTDAVGFHYKYDPKTEQFAHASGIYVLTPQGRISKMFYGVEYAPRDLRLALVEASNDKIGSPVDQVLLFCFHYDPSVGKYTAVAMHLIQFAGAAFVLIGSALLFFLFRRDRDYRHRVRHA